MIVGLLLVIGMGCTVDDEAKQPEQDIQQPEDQDTEQPQEHEKKVEQDKNDEVPEEQAPEVDEVNVVDQLKEKELIGKRIEEVQNLLGEPTIEDKNAVLHAWRYDFPSEGYTFDNKLNAVDVDGIFNGDMEAQLIVLFENEVVSSYSIYYLSTDDIMQYWVTEHGTEEFVASAD